MIGILVTSKIEWEALLNVYEIDSNLTDKYTYGDYYKTNIYNKDVLLFRSIGRKAMSSAAVQYMIDKFNLRKVIFIGTATLVADYLDYGDIIIPDRVSEYDLSIREIEPLIKESNIIDSNFVFAKNFQFTNADPNKEVFIKKADINALKK